MQRRKDCHFARVSQYRACRYIIRAILDPQSIFEKLALDKDGYILKLTTVQDLLSHRFNTLNDLCLHCHDR